MRHFQHAGSHLVVIGKNRGGLFCATQQLLRTFNAGFNTVEFTSSALVDMAFHTRGAVDDPMNVPLAAALVVAANEAALRGLCLPGCTVGRDRSVRVVGVRGEVGARLCGAVWGAGGGRALERDQPPQQGAQHPQQAGQEH